MTEVLPNTSHVRPPGFVEPGTEGPHWNRRHRPDGRRWARPWHGRRALGGRRHAARLRHPDDRDQGSSALRLTASGQDVMPPAATRRPALSRRAWPGGSCRPDPRARWRRPALARAPRWSCPGRCRDEGFRGPPSCAVTAPVSYTHLTLPTNREV